jgi:valyl-tRNA synthetase
MNANSKPRFGEKNWDPNMEKELSSRWSQEETYSFHIDSENRMRFSIDTPPPYASGRWHLGGAVHYSQIDMIARSKRMQGYEVLFPMGIDRNGQALCES